jgi:hypothetical protein
VKRRAALALLLLAAGCGGDRGALAFSERPELRDEGVQGCGGGALRFFVPGLALPALREAARAQLLGEPPWELEGEHVPCAVCDEHGSVCGYVVARYLEPADGRDGVRVRFRSTVSRAASSWQVLDSERVLDEARLAGRVSFAEARAALDWAREHVAGLGRVESLVSADALAPDEVPSGAELRLSQIVRVEEQRVLLRRVFLRREAGAFAVVADRREQSREPLPPAVRP